jgi:hypothetical protein
LAKILQSHYQQHQQQQQQQQGSSGSGGSKSGPPGFSPTKHTPVAPFTVESLKNSAPVQKEIAQMSDVNLSTSEFLVETNRVLVTAVSRINSIAYTNSLKIAPGNPLLAELTQAQFERAQAGGLHANIHSHAKLDAFEQLMIERKAVAETLAKMQELEQVSFQRIRQAEVASLARIQEEAQASIAQVKEVEHHLLQKATAHMEKVRQETQVLNSVRTHQHRRKIEAAMLQNQRFEEVAEMATALAEQQLRLAAERKEVAKHQFQLNLSLLDLNKAAAVSPAASPRRARPQYPQQQEWHSAEQPPLFSPLTVSTGLQQPPQQQQGAHYSPVRQQLQQNSGASGDFFGGNNLRIRTSFPSSSGGSSGVQSVSPGTAPSQLHLQRQHQHQHQHVVPNWHATVPTLASRQPGVNTHSSNSAASSGSLLSPPPPPPPPLPLPLPSSLAASARIAKRPLDTGLHPHPHSHTHSHHSTGSSGGTPPTGSGNSAIAAGHNTQHPPKQQQQQYQPPPPPHAHVVVGKRGYVSPAVEGFGKVPAHYPNALQNAHGRRPFH